MAPKYKLTYFNAMGLAEPIRLLFAAAKVEYEDVRIEREDWPALKPSTPWGLLPILEVDGATISQSTTIARFLARKFGLMGENEIEAAKVEEYVDVTLDMRTELLKHHFHADDSPEKAALKKKLEEEVLPNFLNKFTKILEKQGNGYLVGKKLSFADIAVAHLCTYTCKLFSSTMLDNHSVVKKFVDGVNNQPGIKEWIQKRPQTRL